MTPRTEKTLTHLLEENKYELKVESWTTVWDQNWYRTIEQDILPIWDYLVHMSRWPTGKPIAVYTSVEDMLRKIWVRKITT